MNILAMANASTFVFGGSFYECGLTILVDHFTLY